MISCICLYCDDRQNHVQGLTTESIFSESAPQIKALDRNLSAFSTLFAPGKSWDNVRSTAAPYTESRLTRSVANERVGFPVVEHQQNYGNLFLKSCLCTILLFKAALFCSSRETHRLSSIYTLLDIVERPDPLKGLSTFCQCTEFPPQGDSNSCPPDMELGALTKWLASRMLVWVVSAGFSTILIYKCIS